MTGRRRVLVTGAAGVIGQVLVARLADEYQLTGIDRRPVRAPGVTVRRVRLPVAPRGAYRSQDAVIDLARRSGEHWFRSYNNNLRLAWANLKAAQAAGVRRVVYFSSNRVTACAERDEPYAGIVAGRYDGIEPGGFPMLMASGPVRPDSPYGVGKAFAEAAGRYYSEQHGLSVICLRIGTVTQGDRPRDVRELATTLTHADLERLVRCAVEAPQDVRFGIVYGVSANTWRFWDLTEAADLIGFAPLDDVERWRGSI